METAPLGEGSHRVTPFLDAMAGDRPQEQLAREASISTRLLRHGGVQFTILLTLALVLRCDTFGDPSLHGDENFYHTVGIAMHGGALPYVDVWDRKPFGLFLIYYLITAISFAPLAYQLAATLFASTTAWLICRLCLRWTPSQGALLAGAVYLLWLGPLQGFGGQSPVFYNLFVVAAASLVLSAAETPQGASANRKVSLAMLLAGLAITIKTTALFEGLFLGLAATIALARSGTSMGTTIRTATSWAAVGAAPSLLIAFGYFSDGHWNEFWHAMVTSNLAKQPDFFSSLVLSRAMLVLMAPVVAIAVAGLCLTSHAPRLFLSIWLVSALAGFLAVPNFYPHYALPVLVPLCIGAAPFLARNPIGAASAALIAFFSLSLSPVMRFEHLREARSAMEQLADAVRRHDDGGPLMTYDGPSQIYPLTGHVFVTPLVFPTHLAQATERDVSHLSTFGETRRVLALRPGAVVMGEPIRNAPVNEETRSLVMAYVQANCRKVARVVMVERLSRDPIAVWGDCRKVR